MRLAADLELKPLLPRRGSRVKPVPPLDPATGIVDEKPRIGSGMAPPDRETKRDHEVVVGSRAGLEGGMAGPLHLCPGIALARLEAPPELKPGGKLQPPTAEETLEPGDETNLVMLRPWDSWPPVSL